MCLIRNASRPKTHPTVKSEWVPSDQGALEEPGGGMFRERSGPIRGRPSRRTPIMHQSARPIIIFMRDRAPSRRPHPVPCHTAAVSSRLVSVH
jgi:hypothetical protein